MANSWLRIADSLVRNAFRELYELINGNQKKIEKKVYKTTATAIQARDVAYRALRAAADTEASLDGKIVTWYQPTDPVLDGETPAVGDLWFDTDDNNHLYRWNGHEWEDAKDGDIGEAMLLAAEAKTIADGKIVTYYTDEDPRTYGFTPVEGDLWFDTDDKNHVYRWSETTSSWESVKDQEIIDALEAAQNAQDTADQKIVSFYQDEPPTDASEGDIWFDTDDGFHIYIFRNGEWISVQDTKIGESILIANEAKVLADKKIVTYYTDEDPVSLGFEVGEGDLWFDTDDKNHVYRWNSDTGSWESVKDQEIIDALAAAQNAQDTADSKIVSFYQAEPPTDASEGDLWFDTDDGFHLYRYRNGEWVSVQDAKIGEAITMAATAQATADGKIVTYYTAEDPRTYGYTPVEGDLWFDTDDKNHVYRWDEMAGEWKSVKDQEIIDALDAAQNAQDTADQKIVSFYQDDPPADASEGDIWFDTDDGFHMYRYRNGEWLSVQDAKIGEAITMAANAQSTADGRVVTFFYPDEPQNHDIVPGEGDLWFDTDDKNHLYRWDSSTGSWVSVQDQKIIDALAAAQNAQDTADGKIVSFYQEEPPTDASEGDIWFDTNDGFHMYRYRNGAWTDVQDQQIGEAINAAAVAQATADGKIVTYYYDDDPRNHGKTPTTGDLWFDTDDKNHLYRWENGAWVSVQDQKIIDALEAAQNAQDTADHKIVSFYTDTDPVSAGEEVGEGDIWFDTDDGFHMYTYRDGQWRDVQDADIAVAINKAAAAQATADGKCTTYYLPNDPRDEGYTPSEGDLWFDTDDDNKAYRWSDSAGAWEEIRDQKIIEALEKAQNAQDTADGKIVSYYCDDKPELACGASPSEGDIWFDTNNGFHIYRYRNGEWLDVRDTGIAQAINAAANAQATADGKIVTFYQPDPPTGQSIGDLWVDTDDGNHLYRWDGSQWVSIQDEKIITGYYNEAALKQDLMKGVSLIFKDISEFDETFPSGICVGNISLNSDGTVAYGSRGVAITKNGIAGFDDTYNGDGDLPSFEIDTLGNATFRGTVSGAAVQGIHGTFSDLVAGDTSTKGIQLTPTDLTYYRNGSSFTAVKKVITGTGKNNDTINLVDFYDRAPTVFVVPASLQCYSSDHSAQSQQLNLAALNLSGSTETGEWSFTLKTTLNLMGEEHTSSCPSSSTVQFTEPSDDPDAFIYEKTYSEVSLTAGLDRVRLESTLCFHTPYWYNGKYNYRRTKVWLFGYCYDSSGNYVPGPLGDTFYYKEFEHGTPCILEDISTEHVVGNNVATIKFVLKMRVDLTSPFYESSERGCSLLEGVDSYTADDGKTYDVCESIGFYTNNTPCKVTSVLDGAELDASGTARWIAIG